LRRSAGARPAWVAAGALAVLIAAGALRSRERVLAWRDDETLFRSALAVAQGSTATQSQLVAELVRQGREAEAEALLPPWSALAGTRPGSYHERRLLEQHGLIAQRRGDWTRSAEAFGAIADTPYAQWHDLLNLGTALVNSARPDEARAVFERLLVLRPDSAAALRMLARIEIEEERWNEAGALLAEATRVEPTNELGWYFRAWAAWRGAGEPAALAVISGARASGVRLDGLFAQDRERWNDAGDTLRAALRGESP
jgi:tetratricopeptide (TPR) repeat protein